MLETRTGRRVIRKNLRDYKDSQKEVLSLEITPIKNIYLSLKDAQVTHPTTIPTCGSAVTREGQDIQFCKKQLLKIKFNSWHVLQYFLCSKLNTEATHGTAVLAKYSKGNKPSHRRPA